MCHFYTVFPHLIYGELRGMTICSLVEAVLEGAMSVEMAPGRGACRVGVNLIADRLENWKKRAGVAAVDKWVVENAQNSLDQRRPSRHHGEFRRNGLGRARS